MRLYQGEKKKKKKKKKKKVCEVNGVNQAFTRGLMNRVLHC